MTALRIIHQQHATCVDCGMRWDSIGSNKEGNWTMKESRRHSKKAGHQVHVFTTVRTVFLRGIAPSCRIHSSCHFGHIRQIQSSQNMML